MHAFYSGPVELVGWAKPFLEGILYFSKVDGCSVRRRRVGRWIIVASASVLGSLVVFEVECLL